MHTILQINYTMKKLLFLILSVFCLYSCIKKKALKYDPELVGTWISSTSDSTFYWLVVTADGNANYRRYKSANNDDRYSGTVKYSAFELKMWVGDVKFKVKEWLTADMKGVNQITSKDYETLVTHKYNLDRRMVLRSTLARGAELITFYRIEQ